MPGNHHGQEHFWLFLHFLGQVTVLFEPYKFIYTPKNRITKLAVKETKCKELEKFFSGPTATAISSDPIMSAKILAKYAKSNSPLKIVAGFMDGKVLEAKDIPNYCVEYL